MSTASPSVGSPSAESQQTLAQAATVSGIALMLGVRSTLTFRPAPPETGIVFVRTDLAGTPHIAVATADDVAEIGRCTAIQHDGVTVQTVEHVLSALAGLGIDNAYVELDAPEPPIGDGSALPFVDAIRQAGVVTQDAPRRFLEVTQSLYVTEEDRQVVLLPADRFMVTFSFDRYRRPGIDSQIATFTITPETFEREIAPARTFCFDDEVEALRAAGLGKGADDSNVLIVTKDGLRNNRYRLENELVRHKILDLIGDLSLIGRLPRAHVIAIRSHHALNLELVRRVRKAAPTPTRPRSTLELPLGPTEIEAILPHRYPFLLVDRVIELEEDRRIVAIKNVTYNEEFFRGHFPGHPVMPGVLVTEALAQTGGVLLMRRPEFAGKLAYFMTIESAKFRHPVIPGDRLRMEVEVLRLRRATGKLRGVATVEGRVVVECDFSFAIVSKEA